MPGAKLNLDSSVKSYEHKIWSPTDRIIFPYLIKIKSPPKTSFKNMSGKIIVTLNVRLCELITNKNSLELKMDRNHSSMVNCQAMWVIWKSKYSCKMTELYFILSRSCIHYPTKLNYDLLRQRYYHTRKTYGASRWGGYNKTREWHLYIHFYSSGWINDAE